jgi:outer membrane protein assembly factor BamE (lipoprotein component of BamABCDE complex)
MHRQPHFTAMNLHALLSLLLLALAGCATTPAERIAKDQAAYAAWPPDVQARVKAGEVAPGFTPAQVRTALGEPDHIYSHTAANGTAEVWGYRSHQPRISVGVGVMGGGGGTRAGGSTVMSSGGPYQDEVLRVVLEEGRVSAIEKME